MRGQSPRLHETPVRESSGLYGSRPPRVREEPGRPLRVLFELMTLALLLTAAVAVFAGELGTRIVDQREARAAARGEALVREAMQAVQVCSFAAVATYDGASLLDGVTLEQSRLRLDLAVKPAAGGLLQVQGVLKDSRTGTERRRFVTYRSRA